MALKANNLVKQEEELNKKFSVNFTKRELLVIYNIILFDEDRKPRKYAIGDAAVISPILNKIQPFVAVASNIVSQEGES